MLTSQILWIMMGYFVGAIPFGLLIARTFCHIDPRREGSRSTGATNVARLCGFPYGVLTLACDVGKGALPVCGASLMDPDPLFVSMTGFACVLGHVFSCFMRFRGGKAVATSIGVFIPLAWLPLLGSCALCLLVIWRSGFVSLGSLTLLVSLPIILMIVGQWQWVPLATCLCLLVVFRHRENISRLLSGTEKSWQKSKN